MDAVQRRLCIMMEAAQVNEYRLRRPSSSRRYTMSFLDIAEFLGNSGLWQVTGHSGSTISTANPTKSSPGFTWNWAGLSSQFSWHVQGDVVRIQPNHIVFNTIDAIDDIYGHNTKTNKGETYSTAMMSNKYPPSIATELYHLGLSSLIKETKRVMRYWEELLAHHLAQIRLRH